MQVELGMLGKLEIANPGHKLAEFFAADPWEAEDVHPHLQW